MVEITLYNGRGQLGRALYKAQQDKLEPSLKRNVNIYHTWNFLDKSYETQLDCYRAFVEFVKNAKNKEVVFISTYSTQDTSYTYYKQLAEAHLLSTIPRSKIIRLPIIIGKGICKELQNESKSPHGLLELISPEEAARQILDIAEEPPCKNRIFRINGEIISAKLATRLLTFK